MDLKESVPPAYVAQRTGTTTLFPLVSMPLYCIVDISKIPAQHAQKGLFHEMWNVLA
jgi:hypothetical protein